MSRTNTNYEIKLSQIEEVPQPDSLIAGLPYRADIITLAEAGEYHRGELLMTGSDGGFSKATESGAKTASELCILARDITIEEGQSMEVPAFFRGVFTASRVILPYENADIEAVRSAMRKQGLFLS